MHPSLSNAWLQLVTFGQMLLMAACIPRGGLPQCVPLPSICLWLEDFLHRSAKSKEGLKL
jgi:hypothetical protein